MHSSNKSLSRIYGIDECKRGKLTSIHPGEKEFEDSTQKKLANENFPNSFKKHSIHTVLLKMTQNHHITMVSMPQKVTSDCNKQFSSDIPKLNDCGGKVEQDVMLDAIGGEICHSIDLSQSRNGSNAYHFSGKSDPGNNCKNENDCSAVPRFCGTSEISLISQEDLFYMDKTVTDIELPHLSVATKTATVKDICIDDGMQMFEKILVEYGKVDQALICCSNFSRLNGNSAKMMETKENDKTGDLKPLSNNECFGSFGKILDRDVGEREFSSPKCAAYLDETIDKTAKNHLRSLVTGHPDEQFCSSNSINERRPLDTTKITACTLPFEEIIDQKSPLLEEFNTDSFSHNDCTSENQDLKQNFDQAAEEEDLTSITASSLEKIKESIQFAGTVSSNKDPLEFDGVAVISDLKAGDSSLVGNENKVINNQQIVQSQNSIETEEAASDDTTSARSSFSHLTHGDLNLLEPAGSITNSSHIPYSGNISYRSESSTTSGQSFAFPVLQPEWNSSPVRMAKADRRHLRKHRWKSALTCCNF